jgi:hypothetical protein
MVTGVSNIVKNRYLDLFLSLHNLTSLVITALWACLMRGLWFQAIRANARCHCLQKIMSPPFATAGFGMSSFRICHTCLLSIPDKSRRSMLRSKILVTSIKTLVGNLAQETHCLYFSVFRLRNSRSAANLESASSILHEHEPALRSAPHM